MNPEWNDVQCPNTSASAEDAELECELRINHEGQCRTTIEWTHHQWMTYGPHEPLSLLVSRLEPGDPALLISTTLQAYVPMLVDRIFH